MGYKVNGADADVVWRVPLRRDVYKALRNMMLIAKEEGIITTAQYKNALGQFRHRDYESCYGFLPHKNLYDIIKTTAKYANTKRPYLVTKANITFDKPVKRVVIGIDLKKEDS